MDDEDKNVKGTKDSETPTPQSSEDVKSKFMKYPKIFALGKEENKDIFNDAQDDIVIQEKMDGANFRFVIKNNKVIFGSRTQQLTSNEGEDSNVPKNFRRTCEHIREQLKEKDLNWYEGFIFYGEAMHKHTMEYDWERVPPYLGFDIYFIKEKRFIDINESIKMFLDMGLSVVPTIETRKAGVITQLTEEDVPISAFPPRSNPTSKAEGIVLKNYNKQIFAKFVRAEFKEENAKTFGGTPKFEETDTGKIVARFCTNTRIDKAIFKLVDEGHELDLPMMKFLPREVNKDIWEENWKVIIDKYDHIEVRKMRKMITRRCLSVLRQVMVNNALENNEVYNEQTRDGK